MVSLCNVRNSLYPTHVKADRVVPKIAFGEEYPQLPEAGEITLSDRKALLGVYRLPTGGEWVVHAEGDQLRIGAPGQDAAEALADLDEPARKKCAENGARIESMVDAYAEQDYVPLNAAAGVRKRKSVLQSRLDG